MVDIRTSRRFPVQLPAKVLLDKDMAAASTANISAAGVYLLLDGGLEVGSPAKFEITIPRDSIGSDSDVCIRCHGRVVRCDEIQEEGRSGVACVIERYEFVRTGEVGGKS